jgi:hypothetical protein
VGLLCAVASLAGYVRPLPLGLHIEPDLVRFDAARRRVFIGDAKETESPGSLETGGRLSAYAHGVRPLLAAGWDALFVVCHGSPYRADRWCACLTQAIQSAGLMPSSAGGGIIDYDAVLAWATLAGSDRRRCDPPGSVSSRPWPAFPATVIDPCARSTFSAEGAA